MKLFSRLLAFALFLTSAIVLAQPGRERVETSQLNNKSLFDLANHFSNHLGVLFEADELLELSNGVRQLDSLDYYVGANSGYSLLSLQQTKNQSVLEVPNPDNDYFLAGFVYNQNGEIGLDFYAVIENDDFSDQENEIHSEFIEDEIERYFGTELGRVKAAPDAIAYGIEVYLDIILGRYDMLPSNLEGGEPNVGQDRETFTNKRPKPGSPYIYFEEQTTFMGLAGIPIPLPAGVFATFYPVGHEYEGCLWSFTLDREINSSRGTDERRVYKSLTYTSSTPYGGKFAGYGHPVLPQGRETTTTKFKRYSYEEFVQTVEIVGLPSYSEGKVIGVTRGIVYSCVEGRTSAKYATKTNNYVITTEDISDPVINTAYEQTSDGLSYLGVNEFVSAQAIFEGYTTSIAWDNILGESVSTDQSHDRVGGYSCIVDSLANETHIKTAIANGQSYITKLRDNSVAIIAIVNNKQYFVYQPFGDQQGAEYMIYHESGWFDIEVIHDQTVNDFVNAMVYVGRTIAIASFIVANIAIGNSVAAGMAIAGYSSFATVSAVVGIDLVFAGVEGGVVLFITDDPDKAKTAFLVAAGGALVGGGLEVLALRGVKSFSKYRFGRRLGETTEGFDVIIKVRRADGTEISRRLRQFTNDLKAEGFSEARIKILFDEMNSNAKFTNFVLSADGLDGAKAWDALRTLLPNNLKHFATDLEHLKFLKNTDVQDALTWIKNEKPQLFNNYPDLTPGEVIALNHYTTTPGYQINFWLRGKPIKPGVLWSEEHANSYIKFLDSAFDKLPRYSGNSVLLRFEGKTLAELENVITNFNGANTPLEYPNFISTSKNTRSSFIDPVKTFQEDEYSVIKQSVFLEVNNNGSFKVIDFEPFSRASEEFEALVIRGKKMKVTNIQQRDFVFPSNEELAGTGVTRDDLFEEWITKDTPTTDFDLDGNVITVNPNAISLDNFISGNYTLDQLEAAKKITTIFVDIID